MDINKKKSKKQTRIFFATDIHGSEICFKKFIKAGEFYKADVLVLGGDISGKKLIPMIEDNGIWTTIFSGSSYSASSNEELQDVEKKVRAAGFYPYRTNMQEVEELNSNPEKLKQLFEELMFESMKRWMKMAEERNYKRKPVEFETEDGARYYSRFSACIDQYLVEIKSCNKLGDKLFYILGSPVLFPLLSAVAIANEIKRIRR